MFRLFAVAAVALTLGLGGSAGWNGAAHAAPDSPLETALLSQDDLPAGWTVAGPLAADAGVAFACPASAASAQPTERLGVLLVDSSGGQMAYQNVRAYRPGEADQVLSADLAETAPCHWPQPMDDGASAGVQMSAASAAPFGDEAAQRQLEMRDDAMVVEGSLVEIRCGDWVTQLTLLTMGREALPQDADLMHALALAAIRRLCPADL